MLSDVSLMSRIYSGVLVHGISVFSSRVVCAVGNRNWEIECDICEK